MTSEADVKRELDIAIQRMKTWWMEKIPANSYPKKLYGKIQYLKAYLEAYKNVKNETKVNEVIKNLKLALYEKYTTKIYTSKD